jgi:hypothetical protein
MNVKSSGLLAMFFISQLSVAVVQVEDRVLTKTARIGRIVRAPVRVQNDEASFAIVYDAPLELPKNAVIGGASLEWGLVGKDIAAKSVQQWQGFKPRDWVACGGTRVRIEELFSNGMAVIDMLDHLDGRRRLVLTNVLKPWPTCDRDLI